MNMFLVFALLLINANPVYKDWILSFRYEQAKHIEKLCNKTPDFFFYKAISQFKTKDYKGAIRSIDQLLMMNAPERYFEVAVRLKDEIEREKNKMDDIASDMTLSQERIESGQIDKKAIAIQKEIIRKLDEEIKSLEDSLAKESKQQAGNSGQNMEPTKESKIIETAGDGKVSNKKLVLDSSPWGKLPEKDKVKAIESLGRQLPPHIKEAAEGFSKKLNGVNNIKKN